MEEFFAIAKDYLVRSITDEVELDTSFESQDPKVTVLESYLH